MASRDTPRGVSPVLGGVCANLLRKRSKAALSYSTQSNTPVSTHRTGRVIFMPSAEYQEIKCLMIIKFDTMIIKTDIFIKKSDNISFR